jgi:NAD(P)-dependent dehydrogenase (short-subunit alcohol dehydrogenase family)
MAELDGRAVIVTGAARGLGAAYAREIADAGAGVLLMDVDDDVRGVADEIRAHGARAVALVGSSADTGAAEAAVAACLESFGGLHGLVNNAGIYREAPFWEEDPVGAANLVTTNVTGPIVMGIAAGRQLRRQGTGGAIVNITSGAAMGYPRVSTYCASKGAVLSLTYAWALDGRPHGIRVNAVAPIAATAMTSTTEHQRATAAGARPPETVAPLVAHLLSDEAADITGQAFRFDGSRLQILRGPRPDSRDVTADGWTRADIAAALRGDLASRLSPVGALDVSSSG